MEDLHLGLRVWGRGLGLEESSFEDCRASNCCNSRARALCKNDRGIMRVRIKDLRRNSETRPEYVQRIS